MDGYQPNQPYQRSYMSRLNRHVLPPADFTNDSSQRTTIKFDQGTRFSLKTDKYGDPGFIAELCSCQPLEIDSVFINWEWSQKALAQDILPFLLLGPMSFARDSKKVEATGITMLLAVRDGTAAAVNPKIMDPARFASAAGIQTATFDVMSESDMVQRCSSAIRVMIDHLEAHTKQRPIESLGDVGGRILVFCEAGDRRSAALVVLFFMVIFGLSTTQAIQAVQSRRYGILIDGEYHRMIKSYEDILQAEKQIASEPTVTAARVHATSSQTRKRNIDQAQDEDELMIDIENESDLHRPGTAPFRDVTT